MAKCTKCTDGYIVCPRCHGAREIVCPKCEGEGKLTITRNGEVFPASAHLPGFGRIVTCRKCGGNQYLPCQKCDQMGELVCDNCNGTTIYIPKHLR